VVGKEGLAAIAVICERRRSEVKMKELQPLDVAVPNKEDILKNLNVLLEQMQSCYKQYQDVTEYGKLNYVAFLGEMLISSESRFNKWEDVFLGAIYLIENPVE
jgi:hypothetical protein